MEGIIEQEPPGIADAMMNRGNFYRMMAQMDELERLQNLSSDDEYDDEVQGNEYYLNENNQRVLKYATYLSHQRYYDDFKHVDFPLIDYSGCFPGLDDLIVEQRKSLGKGGFCWDAAFILAHYMIENQVDWNCAASEVSDDVGAGVIFSMTKPEEGGIAGCMQEIVVEIESVTSTKSKKTPRILELGAGTGCTGLLVAKAAIGGCDCTITDLPELIDIMNSNIQRNFEEKYDRKVNARVLRWGINEDYFPESEEQEAYDVIFGADIVASIYDPTALVLTLHSLAGENTKIYMSYRKRWDEQIAQFLRILRMFFGEIREVAKPSSIHRNPGVYVIEISSKLSPKLL